MKDFFEEDKYDGVDDNVEILLEGPEQDPNQAYLYIRIKARPDEQQILVECDDDGGWLYTANTDMCSILTNGTDAQLTMMFLELFQMNDIFMDAVAAAVQAMKNFNPKDNG